MASLEELQTQIRNTHLSNPTVTVITVAQWLEEHLIEVAWKTIDDIASETGVSAASVIRSCQGLGFDGYSHLQRLIRDVLPTSEGLVDKLNDTSGADPAMAVPVRERNVLELFDTTLADEIEAAAHTLAAARKIAVMAALSSETLGAYVASHLNFLLGNAVFYEAGSSASLLFVRDAGPEDTAIILTFPRYARSSVDLLLKCQKIMPNTILITDRRGARLYPHPTTIALPISGDLFSAGPPVTVLVQMLAHALKRSIPDQISARLEATDKVLGKAGAFLSNTPYQLQP